LTGTLDCYQCDTPPTVYLSTPDGERIQLTIPDNSGKFRFSHLKAQGTMIVEVDTSFQGVAILHDVKVNYIPDYRKFRLTPVYFNLAESEVRPESYAVISQIADFLSANPDYQLEIIAHADITGNEEFNLLLTRQRGKAVFDALLRSGVSPVSMMIRARGSSEPAAENKTPLGRQLNRRVEFEISGKGEDPPAGKRYCFTKTALNGAELGEQLPSELIQLNGIRNDERYRSYLPLVVNADSDLNPDLFTCISHRDK